jgi:hypothetical protein
VLRRNGRRPPVAPTPFAIETIRQMAPDHLQGEIAARLGVSVGSVYRWGRTAGVTFMTRAEGRLFSARRNRPA